MRWRFGRDERRVRLHEAIGRVGLETVMLERDDLSHVRRGELLGNAGDGLAGDGYFHVAAHLLRGRNRLPARAVEGTVFLFCYDENHDDSELLLFQMRLGQMARASSLSSRTSSLAASCGVPSTSFVCLLFSGT